MKKLVLFGLVALGAGFQFCTSTKKAAETTKVSYAKNVHPIIQASCAPCHIAGQGKAKALNNFEAAKVEVDDMIVRMKKNPDEKGFMPLRHPKLPDATIAVFEQWKADGLVE